MTVSVKDMIKKPVSQVFRRAKIKRRSNVDGTFENTWFDISADVKSYGKITHQVDSARRFKFTFGTAKLVVENDSGRFNPSDSPTSYWFNFMNQQRTLVKIEAGFRYVTQASNGLYTVRDIPTETLWDDAIWDGGDEYVWDDPETVTVFVGILSGDIPLSDKSEVTLNIRPLVSVFQDFPATNLTGWTSTGITASQFMTMLRDQVDSSGNYIFRPFFGDTVTYWDISTTSTIYANLNTSTAKDVLDRSVWEVVEKLAEVESFVPYITKDGVFKFVSRESVATTVAFEFHGAGSFSSEYGQTIKAVNSFGFRISKYYSRVQLKWVDSDTTTSYVVEESALEVSPTNNPWTLGVRTLAIENFYIPSLTAAQTLALSIFTDVSGFKKEIDFTTTFIPHLDLFDRISLHYDPASTMPTNLWDLNNWANDGTGADTDLVWDKSDGNALYLTGEEFKFLSMEIDLDNFSNKFIAREV